MKTAELQIAAVEFTCPECGENCSAPSGSHMWLLYEISDTMVCDCCKATLKAPAKAKKLRDGYAMRS